MNLSRSMRIPFTSRTGALIARALLALACLVWACGESAAQDAAAAQREDSMAAPPMRHLPEETRRRLAAESDVKDRTRLSIELAEERLARAADHTNAERYGEAAKELAVYEAIIKDVLTFLRASSTPKKKLRDHFKRVELSLRAHVTRIETIRRGMPSQSGVHARATLDFVRDARTEALNAFYDDTVIPDRQNPPEKTPPGQRDKGTASAQPPAEKKPEQR